MIWYDTVLLEENSLDARQIGGWVRMSSLGGDELGWGAAGWHYGCVFLSLKPQPQKASTPDS